MEELANILAKAIRHRIGSIVNQEELYAKQYAKDADNLTLEAQKVAMREHWNQNDRTDIEEMLRKKLKAELEKKDFLPEKKFEMMGKEIKAALREIGILR